MNQRQLVAQNLYEPCCGAVKHDAAIREAIQAIELNPSNALAQGWLGAALVFAGREEEGIPAT